MTVHDACDVQRIRRRRCTCVVRTLPAPGAHCNEVTLCCSYVTSTTVCCMLVTAQARLHTCGPWCTSCQGRVAAAAAGPTQGQAPPQMVSGAATSAPRHLAAVAVVQQRIRFHCSSLQHEQLLLRQPHEYMGKVGHVQLHTCDSGRWRRSGGGIYDLSISLYIDVPARSTMKPMTCVMVARCGTFVGDQAC